ncbi:MAG TPA: Crp/Fnr family transcriptional regulator [Segetibacter sp.]
MFAKIKAYYKKLVPAITDTELGALEECLTIRRIEKGGFLVRQGQVCNYVTFINEGLVRIFYNADGKDVAIGFIAENEYTSEYESFLTRKPAAQNIDVLSDAVLIDLAYNDVRQLYKTYPSFQEFGRKIAEHLFIMLNQRNTSLLILSPEERYRYMIEKNDVLLQQVPQYMLASYIGVTPEHLSRIRKKMMTS